MSTPKSSKDKRLSELSDAELKCRELHITDPYSQDGLVDEKPDDFEAIRGSLEIINTYSFERYPVEKVKCMDCNSARHGEGCTLQAPDGRKFLLGSECGPRLLGRSWTELKKVFGRHRDRKYHLVWLETLSPRLLRSIQNLDDWELTAKALRDSRQRFRATMPTLFELLSQHDHGDGILYEHRKIERDDEEVKKGLPRIEYVAIGVHRAVGLKYLTDPDPVERVITARKELIEVHKEAAGRKFLPAGQLVRLKRKFDTAVRRLQAVEEFYDQALAFHRADNLRGVATWWTLTRDKGFEASNEVAEMLEFGTCASVKLSNGMKALDRTLLAILDDDLRKESARKARRKR